MEELKATALGLLNNHCINIKDKIHLLSTFKLEATELLNSIDSDRSKNDLNDYIYRLDRQLNVLNHNGQYVVA